jgi:hypothetical protein
VDRVHSAVDRWRGRVHVGPTGSTDTGRGGARALEDVGVGRGGQGRRGGARGVLIGAQTAVKR